MNIHRTIVSTASLVDLGAALLLVGICLYGVFVNGIPTLLTGAPLELITHHQNISAEIINAIYIVMGLGLATLILSVPLFVVCVGIAVLDWCVQKCCGCGE